MINMTLDGKKSGSSMNKKIKTWITEDNEAFRLTLIESFLEHERIEIEKDFESCEALLSYLQNSEPPDVLLMDIGLPGISGIEGVKQIKAEFPQTLIIMVTVYQDSDRIFKALCYGASGYLLKSSSIDEIENAIYDVLRGGAPINSQIARKVLDMFLRFRPPEENYGLTEREKQVLELLVEGFAKKKIADTVKISYHKVDSHVKNIYTKLQVHSGSEAVAKALRENLI
ncbi:MAG: DNA-binding response regulator [Balneolaceae bacterium]|nr:MAG: DNA-binding response regulator [Balneolaceae bacterium]